MDTTNNDNILTVSQLNQLAREKLEREFSAIWVIGEISNLTIPSSGHMYLSLKDDKAQIRCALFRNARRHVTFMPQNGQRVNAFGRISLYESRGDYQLIIERLEEGGDGLLHTKFEQLKNKLQQAGLFAQEIKTALPAHPQRIGIISSATGAALRDILTTLKRRAPHIPVIIYPCQVQGKNAHLDIISAIEVAHKRDECDVLILARGGGSLEDLWCFNEEALAYAIHEVSIPVVTGVGHETDFTIADFVADTRAATPTAAAELVSPNRSELINECQLTSQRLVSLISFSLQQAKRELELYQAKLKHPKHRLQEVAQQLDLLEHKLSDLMKKTLYRNQDALNTLYRQLHQHTPMQRIAVQRSELTSINKQLNHTIRTRLNQLTHTIEKNNQALQALSPLATLERGYAIVFDQQNNVIHNADQVTQGDSIEVKLAKSQINCQVE